MRVCLGFKGEVYVDVHPEDGEQMTEAEAIAEAYDELHDLLPRGVEVIDGPEVR